MTRIAPFRTAPFLMLAALLVAATPALANVAPAADAGADKTVDNWHGDGSERVSLNGSASSDSDGAIVAYEWFVGGSLVNTGETSDTELPVGTTTVTLIVADDGGASDTDTVQVTVREVARADAGPDLHLTDVNGDGVESVLLDGSASSCSSATITGYTWKQRTQQIASGPVATVDLPVGWHSITLEIADSLGRTEYDVVNVLVEEPFAADWYLDAVNGDDATGDGSAGNPFQSVGRVWGELSAGDVVALADGSYGTVGVYQVSGWYPESPPDVFTDWVTFRAAAGARPVLDWVRMGAKTAGGARYEAYMAFSGLTIANGVRLQNAGHVRLEKCRISREPPYVGSADNIEKKAVELTGARDVTIQDCEITDTGTGIQGSGDRISIVGCHIHGGSHDGIRPWNMDDSLIEDCDLHDFDDGVSDGESTGGWNRHCDLIHVSIRGPGFEGWGTDGLIISGNRFWNVESQSLIVNGYYATSTRHSNILVENNIFGPSKANLANIVEKCDGFIFRNNTICDVGSDHTFHRWPQANYQVRIGALGDVEVYNNIVRGFGIDSSADLHFFDYNLLTVPDNTNAVGVDDSRCYGRFTLVEGVVDLADGTAFDGRLEPTSDAINAGTRHFAPSPIHANDVVGTLRDNRPDLGAWELPGQSPAAETDPPIYDDLKTTFVDDFEDGHYNDVDPWLQAPNTQGLSWYRPEGFGYQYAVKYSSGRGLISRNYLRMPTGSTDGRQAWLLSHQGGNWVDYSFQFNASNAYLGRGGGVCVLVVDDDTCYYFDLAQYAGNLIRIVDGVKTTLATEPGIQLPNSGERAYRITVDVEPDGITFDVDADNNGTVEMTFTDTDPAALARFTSGGVGFHCDGPDKWHVLLLDTIRVEVTDFVDSFAVSGWTAGQRFGADALDLPWTPGQTWCWQAGLKTLSASFAAPADPATVGPGTVTLTRQSDGADLAAMVDSVVLSPDGRTLTVTLVSPLASGDRYAFALAGLADTGGNPLTGNSDLLLPVLPGDVDSSGAVGPADVVAAREHVGRPLDATPARGDVNADGTVNGDDLLEIRSLSDTALP